MSSLANYLAHGQSSDAILIERHSGLVSKIANHLACRLPDNILVEDLVQAGMIGLLEASKKYDEAKGASFETFASIRIRGAMLDEVRKGDWIPRSVHRTSRTISEAIKQIENDTGRDAKDVEVAQTLGVELNEYHKMLNNITNRQMLGFDDIGLTDDLLDQNTVRSERGPYESVQNLNFHGKLADAIAGLPERECLVVALYYDEELNLKEIGEVLGVSESRVCQIHSQAMLRLRSRMSEWHHAK